MTPHFGARSAVPAARIDSKRQHNSKIAQQRLLSEPGVRIGQPPRIAPLGVCGRNRGCAPASEVEQLAKAALTLFPREEISASAGELAHAARRGWCGSLARHGPPSMRGIRATPALVREPPIFCGCGKALQRHAGEVMHRFDLRTPLLPARTLWCEPKHAMRAMSMIPAGSNRGRPP